MKNKGFIDIAVVLAGGLVMLAVGVGLWFQHKTDQVDSPLEQVAEGLLEQHGIEVDFSADKKAK